MHRQGALLARQIEKPANPGPIQEIYRPSLALFDRRQLDYVAVSRLPLPAMRDGERAIRISPDIRQALCYQCHAPLATAEVDSGDDRTAIGVHEGLSCFACHQGHGQRTRASCATCHPQLSNCGLDVETMDTTFKSSKSPHNVHFVKCMDCHTKGVPKKKPHRVETTAGK
jgi:RNase P subunit RPR2